MREWMCATDGQRHAERQRGLEEGERNSELFKWESRAQRGQRLRTEPAKQKQQQQKKWRQVYFTHGKSGK